MGNSAPGYAKHPKHRITTERAGVPVRVTSNGEVVADTREAIALRETGYAVVYYIPRQDVRLDRFVRSAHTTYCPFKGHASYYSLVDGPQNVAWSYEQPYDEVAVIKDRLAFYPSKVDSIVAR